MRGAALALLMALPSAAPAEPRPTPRPGAEAPTVATVVAAATARQDVPLLRPRPTPRPGGLVVVMSSRGGVSVPAEAAVPASPRPMARVAEADRNRRAVAAVLSLAEPVVAADGLLNRSARPALRPQAIPVLGGRVRDRQAQGGGICGRASLVGEAIPPVPGAGACGIAEAVRITRASGLALSRPTRMDCGTARALDDWVRQGVLPAVGRTGGGAVRLEVAAGYSCRTRNNQPGARLSEHSKGRAIDISGIALADGDTVNVLRDWGRGAKGRILRAVWRAACGPFGTVLGPESDRFHRDHFHLDTARYRSGPFCR